MNCKYSAVVGVILLFVLTDVRGFSLQVRGVRRRRRHAAEGAVRRPAAHRAAPAAPGRVAVVRPPRHGARPSAGRADRVRDGPAVRSRQRGHAAV